MYLPFLHRKDQGVDLSLSSLLEENTLKARNKANTKQPQIIISLQDLVKKLRRPKYFI